MSADSSRKPPKQANTGQIILPQTVSDPSIIDSVAGFIHEVVPQAYSSVLPGDARESILWARFETCDYNDPENYPPTTECESEAIPPLLLVLGYGTGVQVWSITGSGEAAEVLSWSQGCVRTLRLLYSPKEQQQDPLAKKRPLVAIVDNAGPGPHFCTLNFISLRTGVVVKSIKFKTPVCDVFCNKKSVVVTFAERIAVFDVSTLEDRLTITTCYLSPGMNQNPVALGPRWLAYAEKRLTTWQRSSGGCEGEGAQSYTATVIHAAKSLGKGLRDLSGSLTGNVPQPTAPSSAQPGIVTIVDIETKATKDDCADNIIAHFVGHVGPIVAMTFDPSGLLLVTADKHGHRFHVFRIHPHPCGPALAAVHHLYVLHRGDTTARVQDIAISWDSRWIAVSSVRGTTHVFPITPYGGPVAVRTHTTPHVVNRLSRFERSAGLSDGRGSPVAEVPCCPTNPRLPPYPHPTPLSPLAQLRRWGSHLPPAPVEEATVRLSAAFAQPRAWVPGRPRSKRPLVESLFVMASHGNLIQYDLDPRCIAGVPKDKISYDTGIELGVEAKAEWVLLRPPYSSAIQPPLNPSNPLICPFKPQPAVGSRHNEDRWLSQVEIITHTGPHRRLWMGPQFSFKTIDPVPPGSMLEGDDLENETLPVRSNPVNMPHRPYLLIESGSGGSVDSPHMADYSEDGDESVHRESRLREDLADAMLDTGTHGSGLVGGGRMRAAVLERQVNPMGTVVTLKTPPETHKCSTAQPAGHHLVPNINYGAVLESKSESETDLKSPVSSSISCNRDLTKKCKLGGSQEGLLRKLPVQEQSKSPAQERSKSPAQERSKSPAQERSKPPAQERSKSPAQELVMESVPLEQNKNVRKKTKEKKWENQNDSKNGSNKNLGESKDVSVTKQPEPSNSMGDSEIFVSGKALQQSASDNGQVENSTTNQPNRNKGKSKKKNGEKNDGCKSGLKDGKSNSEDRGSPPQEKKDLSQAKCVESLKSWSSVASSSVTLSPFTLGTDQITVVTKNQQKNKKTELSEKSSVERYSQDGSTTGGDEVESVKKKKRSKQIDISLSSSKVEELKSSNDNILIDEEMKNIKGKSNIKTECEEQMKEAPALREDFVFKSSLEMDFESEKLIFPDVETVLEKNIECELLSVKTTVDEIKDEEMKDQEEIMEFESSSEGSKHSRTEESSMLQSPLCSKNVDLCLKRHSDLNLTLSFNIDSPKKQTIDRETEAVASDDFPDSVLKESTSEKEVDIINLLEKRKKRRITKFTSSDSCNLKTSEIQSVIPVCPKFSDLENSESTVVSMNVDVIRSTSQDKDKEERVDSEKANKELSSESIIVSSSVIEISSTMSKNEDSTSLNVITVGCQQPFETEEFKWEESLKEIEPTNLEAREQKEAKTVTFSIQADVEPNTEPVSKKRGKRNKKGSSNLVSDSEKKEDSPGKKLVASEPDISLDISKEKKTVGQETAPNISDSISTYETKKTKKNKVNKANVQETTEDGNMSKFSVSEDENKVFTVKMGTLLDTSEDLQADRIVKSENLESNDLITRERKITPPKQGKTLPEKNVPLPKVSCPESSCEVEGKLDVVEKNSLSKRGKKNKENSKIDVSSKSNVFILVDSSEDVVKNNNIGKSGGTENLPSFDDTPSPNDLLSADSFRAIIDEDVSNVTDSISDVLNLNWTSKISQENSDSVLGNEQNSVINEGSISECVTENITEDNDRSFIKTKKSDKSESDDILKNSELTESVELRKLRKEKIKKCKGLDVSEIKVKEIRIKSKSVSPVKSECKLDTDSSDEANCKNSDTKLLTQRLPKRKKVGKKVEEESNTQGTTSLTNKTLKLRSKSKTEDSLDIERSDYETCSEKKSDSSIESFPAAFDKKLEDSNGNIPETKTWSSVVKKSKKKEPLRTTNSSEDKDSVYESCNDEEFPLQDQNNTDTLAFESSKEDFEEQNQETEKTESSSSNTEEKVQQEGKDVPTVQQLTKKSRKQKRKKR